MFVAYPPELDPKQWEKNKGIIAKFAGETGIGKALTELKSTYDGVDQTKLAAGGYGKARSPTDYDTWLQAAKKYYAEKMVPLQEKARSVSALATTIQNKFKANKLIPKSSTEYVGKVAAAASFMAVGCKSLDAEMKTFADGKARFEKLISDARKDALGHAQALEIAVNSLKKLPAPTGKEWTAMVKQKNRSVGNSLGNVPELKAKFWTVWQPLDGLQVKDSETDPKVVKAACDKLLKELPAVLNYLQGNG